MKVVATLLTVLVLAGLAVTAVQAELPPPSYTALWPRHKPYTNLPHAQYFSWAIPWALPEDEEIVEACVFFKKITNTDVNDPTNVLWTHLLDNPAAGVKTFGDSYTQHGNNSDNWNGAGPLLGSFVDTNGRTRTDDVTYWFSQIDYEGQNLLDYLTDYSADGKWGIAFDPDCHYTNCAIGVSVWTTKTNSPPIPEASSIMLGAMGLSGLAGLRRLRRK